MRFRFGRPDLVRYADRFEGPPAGDDAPLTVTWLGVSTLLIDDGSSALLTDGYFSRPSLPRVALRRLTPSAARIDGSLARAGIRRLAAVVVSHTHLDHALDSAVVADRTGAVLVGGESAANIGRGHGLAEDRLVVATPKLSTVRPRGTRKCDFWKRSVGAIRFRSCRSARLPGEVPQEGRRGGSGPCPAGRRCPRHP